MAFYCKICEKWWSHPIRKCIFCGNDVEEVFETEYNVIGFTKVNVSSPNNENVPYFNYLLVDKNGNKIIIKSFEEYQIGDYIKLNDEKTKNNRLIVGVIGTGQMGLGIAECILLHNHEVVLKTRKNGEKIISEMIKKISKNATVDQISEYIGNLKVTTDYNNMKDCDIVIEAVVEDINIKKEVFINLSQICEDKTIFATNTSSISIDEIAKSTKRPEKVIGMHFFNPVSKMKLIEVIIGNKTSKNTQKWVKKFSRDLNKEPILVKDSPGFLVNRLLLPQINEAVLLLEENLASKEDIEKAMKLGLNHPMGPFQLADFIGIDICISILEILHQNLHDEKLKPAKMLYDLEKEGKLGFKKGEGFYKYN
ncbi:3-hydroxyacyl-CoA dehydrogenase family protein [Methanobacterium sp.]|uniref:3-hydroxyacyl-CoA dehydrogenase family protein n=1 Tax=Methanobacterium sp. TaxID=2164 RepID=UPI002ABCF3AC|nr:3-hydroxyacyl-CoA dehydrogenase NAD-binding domain-containing protein [Methanobacterium sp.]MDY9922728.1 3-hydroxyacyl-CoA dehydrogenase NAD-binding domain-containing protein [Methanobacterium sp.]